jgi:hypothetical protein
LPTEFTTALKRHAPESFPTPDEPEGAKRFQRQMSLKEG